MNIIKTIFQEKVRKNDIFSLKSDEPNILTVNEGRIAIIKKNISMDDYEKFLLGVGEEFKIDNYITYYIKSLAPSTIFNLSHKYFLNKENKDCKNDIFSNIDDYYFGYEERYRKIYEEGADLWETEKPNESLLKVFKKFPNIFDGKVIDLGCGEGRDSIYLSDNNINIQAVDISHSAINKAKLKIRQHNGDPNIFKTGNVIYLNHFKDSSFDLAMNMGCLHMMNKNEDRLTHIKNVHRILVNGGYFLVDHCKSNWGKGFHTIENYDDVKEKIKNFNNENYIDRTILVNGEKKKIPLKVIPYLERSNNELIDEITSCGFEVIKVYETDTESFGNSVLVLFKKNL